LTFNILGKNGVIILIGLIGCNGIEQELAKAL